MHPTKFQVNWPLGSGEEAKNRFSRWLPWSLIGFPIGTILAIFDLQVTLMPPTKFQVNWPFISGEEWKIDFQDGCHLRLTIGTILAILNCSHPDAS